MHDNENLVIVICRIHFAAIYTLRYCNHELLKINMNSFPDQCTAQLSLNIETNWLILFSRNKNYSGDFKLPFFNK